MFSTHHDVKDHHPKDSDSEETKQKLRHVWEEKKQKTISKMDIGQIFLQGGIVTNKGKGRGKGVTKNGYSKSIASFTSNQIEDENDPLKKKKKV